MASKETIKQVLYLFRSVTDFPIVTAKTDPDTGAMIAPGTLEAWTLALADLTDEQVMAGGQFVLSTLTDDYKRRPMPGDIRKAVSEAGNKGWAEAWDEIQARGHLFTPGGRRLTSRGLEAPEWSCPEIADAVRQMGGIEACLLHTERNLSAVRAQFRDVYQDIQKRQAFRQCKALPQPPQAPALPTGPTPLALASGEPGEVIDFAARRQQMEAAIQAQYQAGAELVRQTLQAAEAKRLAEYQAKIAAGQQQVQAYQAHREAVEAQILAQQQQAREQAAAEGLSLTDFDLPEARA
jgi:hypothetical protein